MGLPIFSTPVVAAERNLPPGRYIDSFVRLSEGNLMLLVSSSIDV